MRISGKKYLDNNTYSVIIENGNLIKAYNNFWPLKNNLLFRSGKKSDKSFTKDLKDLSDEEILSIVTNKFLNENDISQITYYSYGKNNTSILSCGNSSRKYISLNGFTGFIFESILNKYNIDRYENIFKDKIKKIELYKGENISSYEIIGDRAVITIGFENEIILDSEFDFLSVLLNDTFTENRAYTELKDYELTISPLEMCMRGTYNFKLVCFNDEENEVIKYIWTTSVIEICNTSKEIIIFDNDLIRYCVRIMNERYEKMKNNDMKYQLKMEGF